MNERIDDSSPASCWACGETTRVIEPNGLCCHCHYEKNIKIGTRRLSDAVRELLAVLDAHEIDTFDCDRAGVTHCDCLERARKKVESMMPNNKHESSAV